MTSEKEIFHNFISQQGIRQSTQREHILDIFLKIERHLSVQEIFDEARKKYPQMGYATVSRAMKVICEAGLAERVEFGDGINKYEHKFGHNHHDHLICNECGKIIEVFSPHLEKLQFEMAGLEDFLPSSHRLQIFGECRKCRKKG